MVNLTRIYTRTGDGGNTRLSDNSLTTKTDPRVDAYGSVDELNSAIGFLLATHRLDDERRDVLGLIQNELFDVGADLSNPVVATPEWEPLRVVQPSIDRLESWCDRFGTDLPNLKSFILPGGSPAAAQFHLLRTMARRAERAAWVAAEAFGLDTDEQRVEGGVSKLAITYLNRLSDLFFIMARHAGVLDGIDEILWIPGGERNPNV